MMKKIALVATVFMTGCTSHYQQTTRTTTYYPPHATHVWVEDQPATTYIVQPQPRRLAPVVSQVDGEYVAVDNGVVILESRD